MKGTFFNKMFLLAFFLLISINKTTQSESIELNMIADANLNATASFASFEKQFYLYFLYDINPFLKDNNFRTSAIFKLTSKQRFYTYDISYSFLNKKIDTINSTDLTGNRVFINWIYLADVIANRTLAKEYDHYINININKLFLKQNNFNTLAIRFKVLNKKGDLTIENLFSLPEDIKNAINNKENKYIYNKNLMDSLNKDNYNKNYHKNNYNNINYNNNNINHNYHNDYYNNNNYGNNKYYGNGHYYYHFHIHHNKRYHFHNIGFTYAGIIFAQIWSIIFILYCIVNRRKVNNNRFAVIVGNIQQ